MGISPHTAAALTDAVTQLLTAATTDKDIDVATSALRDLTAAMGAFTNHRYTPKVTIFGSARLGEHTTGYQIAHTAASELGRRGFTVVTGGGPGVMHAGLAGAGSGNGVGIAIELPFEPPDVDVDTANGWPLARQEMFFTRKLALVRNVHGVIGAPGGFGTLDEVFEVITLLQTGKAKPIPVVLLETPDNPLWTRLQDFIDTHLRSAGLIDPVDYRLYTITSDPVAAVDHIAAFWSNYRGLTTHGDDVIMRVQHLPTADMLADIRNTRGVLGPIHLDDETPSLRFGFDKRHWADLRTVIDVLNTGPAR